MASRNKVVNGLVRDIYDYVFHSDGWENPFDLYVVAAPKDFDDFKVNLRSYLDDELFHSDICGTSSRQYYFDDALDEFIDRYENKLTDLYKEAKNQYAPSIDNEIETAKTMSKINPNEIHVVLEKHDSTTDYIAETKLGEFCDSLIKQGYVPTIGFQNGKEIDLDKVFPKDKDEDLEK